jgi:hypothetical protein
MALAAPSPETNSKRLKQLPPIAGQLRWPQPLQAPENPIAAKHLRKMRVFRMARTLTRCASLAGKPKAAAFAQIFVAATPGIFAAK